MSNLIVLYYSKQIPNVYGENEIVTRKACKSKERKKKETH